MAHIKGLTHFTPQPHQAIHPISRMPPHTLLLPIPACLSLCPLYNLQMKSNRLMFIGVSEAVHWTVWLRGKINAALSGISNSICRFGLSPSVFINIYHSYQCNNRDPLLISGSWSCITLRVPKVKNNIAQLGVFFFLYLFLFPSSEMSLQKQPDQEALLCWENVSQLQ